jgi:hypothetical protein
MQRLRRVAHRGPLLRVMAEDEPFDVTELILVVTGLLGQ